MYDGELNKKQIAAIAGRMWDMTTAGEKSRSRIIGWSWRKAVYTDGSEEYLYSNPVYEENVD